MLIQNIGQASLTITDNGNGDITINPGDIIDVVDTVADYLKDYKSYDSTGAIIEFALV